MIVSLHPLMHAPLPHFPVIHATKDNQLLSANTSLRKAPQEGVGWGVLLVAADGRWRKGVEERLLSDGGVGLGDTASAEGQPHVAVWLFLLRHGCS
ncbi:hypothetical protein BHE74_00046691 [Ensete ventricosum]|nr:hypothetical protein BHE74_00046691 [Ensete ventricosum]RZS16460.1 hypothetical protein BHM03_00048450 [Ensete ventricosum]